jgi:hypothetical protein
MSLNKTRKRLIKKLKKQDDKQSFYQKTWKMIEEQLTETHRANIERFVNAGSPFRGGRVFDGVTWRE